MPGRTCDACGRTAGGQQVRGQRVAAVAARRTQDGRVQDGRGTARNRGGAGRPHGRGDELRRLAVRQHAVGPGPGGGQAHAHDRPGAAQRPARHPLSPRRSPGAGHHGSHRQPGGGGCRVGRSRADARRGRRHRPHGGVVAGRAGGLPDQDPGRHGQPDRPGHRCARGTRRGQGRRRCRGAAGRRRSLGDQPRGRHPHRARSTHAGHQAPHEQ